MMSLREIIGLPFFQRFRPFKSCLVAHLAILISCWPTVWAQIFSVSPAYAPAGTIPSVNVGGSFLESQFARLDFAQKLLTEQNHQNEEGQKLRKQMLESGIVSPVDLQAPRSAINEFNSASDLLQHQKPREAAHHLGKAIRAYPKFVSAHNELGIAYEELDEPDNARTEFESAAKLDDKFAESFVNLGKLGLSQHDFTVAESSLEKAAALRPTDAKLLTVLAYSQNSAHEYRHAIATAEQVHSLPHSGLANVHYIAASSAIALKEFDTVQRELELFLKEDPANPLAPSATYNLKILAKSKTQPAQSLPSNESLSHPAVVQVVKTFPNSDELKRALASLGSEDEVCADCNAAPTAVLAATDPTVAETVPSFTTTLASRSTTGPWKIRDTVDEVAVFFSVTNRGKLVNDLETKNLAITDDNKPPSRVLQFSPQSKLPLRLGLLVDVSGSLQTRFAFEKQAATHFLQQMLSNPADLAFVAGFSDDLKVTQDFTSDVKQLSDGIETLKIGGGTAIWDAVSLACWKLAAFPEKERVAKVLVVLTDGEDNLSRISLKRAIQDAENTGVTVYAVSTKDFADLGPYGTPISDADKVLQALTERTGGEAMFPGDLRTLNNTFDKLRDVIRTRYLIAYKPADFQSDGHFRKIAILASRNGKRLKVHARQGYYAPFEGKSGLQ
jgi:Ca-activated chloride channel family protein